MDREFARRANISRRLQQENQETALAGWRAGRVVPFRITMALDMRGLDGPDVDIACGAAEPDVDQWEAGELYPTFEQLLALAELTDMPPHYFVLPVEDPVLAWQTSMIYHVNQAERRRMLAEAPPVLHFTPQAVRARGMW